MDVHLRFMAFLLQDGALYIPTKRAFDIWDTLIANSSSCDMDRKVPTSPHTRTHSHTHTHTHTHTQLGFKWFDIGMADMELETQTQLFQTRVLKVWNHYTHHTLTTLTTHTQVDPAMLDQAGYQCLRNFFETINLAERKLRKISSTYHSIVSSTHTHTVLYFNLYLHFFFFLCVCVCVML